MTPSQIALLRKKFPNAPESFFKRQIEADTKEQNERNNLQTDAGISHPEQRQRPQPLAGSDAGKASGPGLLHCRFTLRRKKLLDVDAKYASVKDLLDCLARCGIIRGDREGEITLEVIQQKIAKSETEQTIIEVENNSCSESDAVLE